MTRVRGIVKLMQLLIYIAIGIAGFVVGRMSKKSTRTFDHFNKEERSELREKAHEAVSERTEERKEEILEMMRNAREHHEELKMCGLEEERKGINRRDVEELLDVSKKTALRYLDELEEEGRIQQIGVGKGVYYMLARVNTE